jgi:hypothetical protein
MKLRRDSGKKYSKGEKLSRFNELTTRISSGGNGVTPNRQIWKSCEVVSREFLWKSWSNGVHLCRRSEREDTWWKSMDLGEITSGESECGEVETPEA